MKNFGNKTHQTIKIRTLIKYLFGTFGVANSRVKKIIGKSKKELFKESIVNNNLQDIYIKNPDL
jgi:hypothetical protein